MLSDAHAGAGRGHTSKLCAIILIFMHIILINRQVFIFVS